MTSELPNHVTDLVCTLAENSTDDDFITGICLRLYGDMRSISKMQSFLDGGPRTREQIEMMAEELAVSSC